jgi:hypothetical protein
MVNASAQESTPKREPDQLEGSTDVFVSAVESCGLSAALIKFDLHGRELALDEAVVQKLQAEALAKAGSSTTLNDLAVILTRALSERKTITLRRAESRALEQLLAE